MIKWYRPKALLIRALVSYGSDELSILAIDNNSPFTNIQAGINRQGIVNDEEALFFKPESEKLTIEQMLQGFTVNGAYQLRRDNQIGSIDVGKDADLVIMKDNIFEMDKYKLHKAKVERTYLQGEVTFNRTLWASLKEKFVRAGIWMAIRLNAE